MAITDADVIFANNIMPTQQLLPAKKNNFEFEFDDQARSL